MASAYPSKLVPTCSLAKSSLSAFLIEETSKIKCEIGYGYLPRPPENHPDGYSGLSYFFTYLALRNHALLYSHRDPDSKVRYHFLVCGKRDEFSGYALRQGEIRSNNIMELVSLILENDLSSLEVLFPLLLMSLFSIDKPQASATSIFGTIYDGFRSLPADFVMILMNFHELIVFIDKGSPLLQFRCLSSTRMTYGLLLISKEWSKDILIMGFSLCDGAAQDVRGRKYSLNEFVSAFKHSLVTDIQRMHKLSPLLVVMNHILVILMVNGDVKIKSAGFPSTFLRSLSQLQEDFYSDFSLLELGVDLSLLLSLCAPILHPLCCFARVLWMHKTVLKLLNDKVPLLVQRYLLTKLLVVNTSSPQFLILPCCNMLPLKLLNFGKRSSVICFEQSHIHSALRQWSVVIFDVSYGLLLRHNPLYLHRWWMSKETLILVDDQVLSKRLSRDYVSCGEIIVAHSGWFRSILDLLYCSLPRPPEVLCDSL